MFLEQLDIYLSRHFFKGIYEDVVFGVLTHKTPAALVIGQNETVRILGGSELTLSLRLNVSYGTHLARVFLVDHAVWDWSSHRQTALGNGVEVKVVLANGTRLGALKRATFCRVLALLGVQRVLLSFFAEQTRLLFQRQQTIRHRVGKASIVHQGLAGGLRTEQTFLIEER